MPWKETNAMDERKDFVLKAYKSKESFTVICRRFGISTKTGYKWLKRFEEGGAAGLEDQPRVNINNRNKTDALTQARLIKLKDKHKPWGAKKILALYKKKYPQAHTPARSTVEDLFKREGYTKKRRRRRAKDCSLIQARIKPSKPNELWTVDFKGWWWTSKKERCEPLTVRDEYSKYILAIEVPEKGDTYHIKAEFEAIFRKYGLPEYIRSDNGPPFGNVLNLWGLTKLSVWWMSLGIKLDRSDPGHPEQNGGHERMHRDMMNELENKIYGDLRLHQKLFEKWRKEFNEVRPHEALGMKTPKEVYVKSEKKYMGGDIELEYNGRMKSRVVNDRGYLNYKQQRIFVGNPFAGYNVGIKERGGKNAEVWFDDFKLGELNPDTLLIETEVLKQQKDIA
jgi:transposase InsO family protein